MCSHTSYLYHHGIKGMRWGIRKHYERKTSRRHSSSFKTRNLHSKTKSSNSDRKTRMKKALKIGAAVAGSALAVYGAYKFSKYINSKNTRKAISVGKAAINGTTKPIIPQAVTAAKTATTNATKAPVSKAATTVAKSTVSKAANTTVKQAVNSVPKYSYEDLLKANNELLKKSMDDILKGL